MNAKALASYLIGHYHVRPRRPFLTNDDFIGEIVKFIEPAEGERVLELSPGAGTITRELAGSCDITAIEGEEDLVYALRHELPDGVELVHAHPEKAPLPRADKFVAVHASKALALNLISTHERGVLVVNVGIARSLVAEEYGGYYGHAAVIAQHYATIELGPRIPCTDFMPRAKDHYQILFVTRKRKRRDEKFERFVTELFRHKRKKTPLGRRPDELSAKEFEGLYKK